MHEKSFTRRNNPVSLIFKSSVALNRPLLEIGIVEEIDDLPGSIHLAKQSVRRCGVVRAGEMTLGESVFEAQVTTESDGCSAEIGNGSSRVASGVINQCDGVGCYRRISPP